MDLSGFDPAIHAYSNNRNGYSFKPRQWARAWCHLLFIPTSAEQTECERCMALTKEKVCRRCKKTYAPTSNGQKYCPVCIPIVKAEYGKKGKGVGTREKMPLVKTTIPLHLIPGAQFLAGARLMLSATNSKEMSFELDGLRITVQKQSD